MTQPAEMAELMRLQMIINTALVEIGIMQLTGQLDEIKSAQERIEKTQVEMIRIRHGDNAASLFKLSGGNIRIWELKDQGDEI